MEIGWAGLAQSDVRESVLLVTGCVHLRGKPRQAIRPRL